jgi:hypothetical protein
MAPQRLEKIESAPGNGMASEASDPQDLVRRLTVRGSGSRASRMTKIRFGKLQKKVPNALKSLDAKLKSAPPLPERFREYIRLTEAPTVQVIVGSRRGKSGPHAARGGAGPLFALRTALHPVSPRRRSRRSWF